MLLGAGGGREQIDTRKVTIKKKKENNRKISKMKINLMNHFKGQQNPSAMPVDARGEGLSTAHWLPFYRSPSNSDDKNLVWGEKPPQKRINNSRPKKILQKKAPNPFREPPPPQLPKERETSPRSEQRPRPETRRREERRLRRSLLEPECGEEFAGGGVGGGVDGGLLHPLRQEGRRGRSAPSAGGGRRGINAGYNVNRKCVAVARVGERGAPPRVGELWPHSGGSPTERKMLIEGDEE